MKRAVALSLTFSALVFGVGCGWLHREPSTTTCDARPAAAVSAAAEPQRAPHLQTPPNYADACK